METFEDGNFVIIIASPSMKRISSGLDESGEILFIDASGNVDRYGLKLSLYVTISCAGGLSVGTLILKSESTSINSRGLNIYRALDIFIFLKCVRWKKQKRSKSFHV